MDCAHSGGGLDKIEYRFDGHRDALHMNFLDQSIAVPSEPYVPKVSPDKKYLIGRCIYNAVAFVKAAKANKTPKCLREIPKDKYVGHARLLGFVSNTGAIFKHGYCCGSSHYTSFNIVTGIRQRSLYTFGALVFLWLQELPCFPKYQTMTSSICSLITTTLALSYSIPSQDTQDKA